MAWRVPQRRAPNPPVCVDGVALFWDGTSRKLNERERRMLAEGEAVFIPKPQWRDWREIVRR